ncbi:hypothetical protein SEUCBS139899_002987 [Sporothrix eucalyptigena]
MTTDTSRTRQQYARLLTDNDNDGAYDVGALSGLDTASEDSIPMTPTSRKTPKKVASAITRRTSYLPTARRFWADFTLGFADGLTVPFALTAGLSSLGRTDTVVFAGMAEVSAGCISMGIGGYLSARQAATDTKEEAEKEKDEESPEMIETGREKTTDVAAVAHHYLAPLALPAELHQQVLAHITAQPNVVDNLVAAQNRKDTDADDSEYGYGYYEAHKDAEDDSVWPVASGVSVALGYLVGGLLPLWPYFFVHHVGDGLRYSFAVCVVALFLFGFVKDFVLDAPAPAAGSSSYARRSRIPWRRLWKSTFEGLQMVILGGIAAIAAVLCVRLFEGASSTSDS